MLRIVFLILVLMCSGVFAQTEETSRQNDKPKAIKTEEFGVLPNGHMKALLDVFFINLLNDPTSQGYIIVYGSSRDVARQERFIKNYILVRRFDAEKINLIKGGFSNKLRTEFWLVPAGADTPELIPTPKILFEIGAVTNQQIKKMVEKLGKETKNEPTAVIYAINYGSAISVSKREKQIRNNIDFRCDFDCPKLVLVNGGKSKSLKTVFWLVPAGAEPPTP